MKKAFVRFLIFTASLMLATSAFAETSTLISNSTTTTIGGANFKASTGVKMYAIANTTKYAVGAKHTNGDKIYSATSTNPTIAETNGTVGTDISAIAIDGTVTGGGQSS